VRVPAEHGNLAGFPVFAEGAPALSYLLLEEAQRRLPWPAGACGVVAAINGRIVRRKVTRFLYLPPDTPVETFASPGIGQSLRFRTPDRVGSALALEEVVVHLEVFRAMGSPGRRTGTPGWLSPPSVGRGARGRSGSALIRGPWSLR